MVNLPPYVEVCRPQGPIFEYEGAVFFLSNQGNLLAREKLIWKIPFKGLFYDFEKKNEKFYFSIFWWKSVVGVI